MTLRNALSPSVRCPDSPDQGVVSEAGLWYPSESYGTRRCPNVQSGGRSEEWTSFTNPHLAGGHPG